MASTIIVPIKLPNGGLARIEARPIDQRQKVGITDALPIEEIVSTVDAVACSLRNALVSAKPDAAKIEFGVEACVEAGTLVCLVCSGSGKANLKITLEWKGDELQTKSEND